MTNLVAPFEWYCTGPDHATDADPIPENVPVIDPPEHDSSPLTAPGISTSLAQPASTDEGATKVIAGGGNVPWFPQQSQSQPPGLSRPALKT